MMASAFRRPAAAHVLATASVAATLVAATTLTSGFAGAALARPLVPAEERYLGYSGNLPACDDQGVLDRIKDRFSQKESEFWKTSLEIVGYDRVKVVALRPWGADHIPRNYCTARALLNDNSYHTVSYSVGEDLGMISIGYGVEWCVQGLDRNLAYAPDCQLARP